MARKQKEQELHAAYQERLSRYQQRVKALKVPGYQEAEQAVLEEIPIETQNAILFESEKPEIVVLALGRNAELRKQLAEATNPVAIGRLLENVSNRRPESCQKQKPRQPQPRQLRGATAQ